MLCGTSAHRPAALHAGEQRHRCAAAANAQSAAPRPVRVSSRMSGGCLGSDQRLARHCSACVLQIIGATNPTAAQPGSVRQKILADWQGGPSASTHRSIRSSVGAVQRWAWRPSRTRATTACMRAPGRWRACARGWYPRALVPQSTIEYRKLFGSCRSALACPSEKPGRKARQGPALRHRPATARTALHFGESGYGLIGGLAACARRCGWERRSRRTRSGR